MTDTNLEVGMPGPDEHDRAQPPSPTTPLAPEPEPTFADFDVHPAIVAALAGDRTSSTPSPSRP